MKRITVTGTRNGANTAFTLAEVGALGAPVFVTFNGQLLAQVTTPPAFTQCILSGTSLTLGLAPVAADDLVAYIQPSITAGLIETPILGVRGATHFTFLLATAPPAGSSVLLFFDGVFLTQVASAPTAQQFTLTGKTIVFGLAPAANTILTAYIEDAGSLTFLHALPMLGLQSRWFSPMKTSATSTPVLAVFLNGILQQYTTALPNLWQYQAAYVSDFVSLTLGIDLVAGDDLQVFVIGVTQRVVRENNLSLFGRVIDELLVLMNEQIDYQEAKMCLNRRWQKILNAWTWSWVKEDGVLTTVPAKTAGTVSVTQDSLKMMGTGTAFATTDIGASLIVGQTSYRVVDVQVMSATQQLLVLDAPYTETTATLVPYQLVVKDYALDPDVVDIFTMTSERNGWGEMEEMSQEQLNQRDWFRTSTSEPWCYVRRGMVDGVYHIELWPAPDARYTIRYVAITRDQLTEREDLLPDVAELLLMAAEEMACGIVASKRAAEKDYPGAQFWQQKGEGRMTHYEESLMELKGKDRHAFGRNTRPNGWGNRLGYGWGSYDVWGR